MRRFLKAIAARLRRVAPTTPERNAPELVDAITTGLAGKPPWTLHARLAAVWWTNAGPAIMSYCDALEAHDANATRAAATAALADLEPAARLIGEITVPGREQCVAALACIIDSLRAGVLPESWPFAVMAEFIEIIRE